MNPLAIALVEGNFHWALFIPVGIMVAIVFYAFVWGTIDIIKTFKRRHDICDE